MHLFRSFSFVFLYYPGAGGSAAKVRGARPHHAGEKTHLGELYMRQAARAQDLCLQVDRDAGTDGGSHSARMCRCLYMEVILTPLQLEQHLTSPRQTALILTSQTALLLEHWGSLLPTGLSSLRWAAFNRLYLHLHLQSPNTDTRAVTGGGARGALQTRITTFSGYTYLPNLHKSV